MPETLNAEERLTVVPVLAALTVRLMVVVCVRLPDVPVTVTVDVPVVAVLFAVRVNVLELVELVGLNDAVTPLGRPEAEKLTVLVKPLDGFTVMVLIPLLPCVTVRLDGEADKLKSAAPTGAASVIARISTFELFGNVTLLIVLVPSILNA